MRKHYGYLVVEGPHDVEFVARLLKPYGFKRVQQKQNVDAFWLELIPTKFPTDDDLFKRVRVPLFVQTESHSIAIHSAIGCSRLAENIQETLSVLFPQQPTSIGVILDADDEQSVNQRFTALITALQNTVPNLIFPNVPGQITSGNSTAGIFILPDNNYPGTLEDILLDVAQVNYPNLAFAAAQYIQTINKDELTHQDLEEFSKPAGAKKARISSMASILKPGKAIQVSIQDNRWLEGDALERPYIQTISAFLKQLFSIP